MSYHTAMMLFALLVMSTPFVGMAAARVALKLIDK
jgi:hypothetical protein